MPEGDFGIVIGIAKYPGLAPLEGPVKDARRFYDWLIRPDGGAVPEANVAHVWVEEAAGQTPVVEAAPAAAAGTPAPPPGLKPPPSKPHPILEEVNDAFDSVLEAARNAKNPPARRLYVYFSGHGCSKEIDHIALLMANATMANLNYSLNAREYQNGLGTCAPFPEQVFFYDCCRSLDQRVRGMPPPWTDCTPAAGRPDVAQYVLYAAGFTQKARESRMQRYPMRQGLFTTALMEALEDGYAADWSRGGTWQVTAGTLASYVYDRVRELAGQEKLVQEPSCKPSGRAMDLVFATFSAPPAGAMRQITVKCAQFPTGNLIVRNNRLKPVATATLADGAATVALVPGPYQFEVRPADGGDEEPAFLLETIGPGRPDEVIL